MAASVGIRGVLVASRAVLREELPPSWAEPDRPGIRRMTALGGFLPPGRTRGRPASMPAAKKQPLSTNRSGRPGASAVRWPIPQRRPSGDAGTMTELLHDTAPTQFAEARGIRFAYRRFGRPGRPPLVFFQHFMGTLDDHDPALSDAFAVDREVILFDNAGVGSSSGAVPDTIEAMARDAISFIDALGLTTVDVDEADRVAGHGLDGVGHGPAGGPHAGVVEQDDLAVDGEGVAQRGIVIVQGAHEVLEEHQRRTFGPPEPAVRESYSAAVNEPRGGRVMRELSHSASVPAGPA